MNWILNWMNWISFFVEFDIKYVIKRRKNPCWLTIDKIRIIHESGFYLFLASSPLSSAYLTERDDSLSDRLKLSVSALSIVIPIQGWIVRELFCFKKSCRWCKQNIICMKNGEVSMANGFDIKVMVKSSAILKSFSNSGGHLRSKS